MDSSLTRERVAAIAALANLELDESELDLFARQLAEILKYVEDIQLADTANVPPTTAVVTTHTVDRADVVHESLDPKATFANAPDSKTSSGGGYFRVPRVIG